MADQSSSLFLHKKLDKGFNLAIGLSKSLIDDGTQLGLSRILGSEMNKKRCLDKCALEAEVIDDTALIETTGSVTRFKNRNQNKTDVGFEKSSRNKEENGGKKKRSKGFKKQQMRCSTKCLNEKKLKGLKDHEVEDKCESKKQIPEGKFGHKGCRKMSATVKYVYRKKETEKLESRIQETDVRLKVSDEDEKVSETVNEKDDGVKLSPEVENASASESATVEFKKSAYTRAEMEALRFVDEPGQRAKWAEVYGGFGPSVAREYNELVADASNRPTQRYNRLANCGLGLGSSRHANPILATPPVLPLCSPSNHRKFDRVGSRVSFN